MRVDYSAEALDLSPGCAATDFDKASTFFSPLAMARLRRRARWMPMLPGTAFIVHCASGGATGDKQSLCGPKTTLGTH